jgi:hypothetical protein
MTAFSHIYRRLLDGKTFLMCYVTVKKLFSKRQKAENTTEKGALHRDRSACAYITALVDLHSRNVSV